MILNSQVNNEIPIESSSTIKTTEVNYNNNETSTVVDGGDHKNRTGLNINITLNKVLFISLA
jgi:hypothetical protein